MAASGGECGGWRIHGECGGGFSFLQYLNLSNYCNFGFWRRSSLLPLLVPPQKKGKVVFFFFFLPLHLSR